MQAMRLTAITIAMSVRTATYGDKEGVFEKFLEALSGEKSDLNKSLDEAKNKGINIEDH